MLLCRYDWLDERMYRTSVPPSYHQPSFSRGKPSTPVETLSCAILLVSSSFLRHCYYQCTSFLSFIMFFVPYWYIKDYIHIILNNNYYNLIILYVLHLLLLKFFYIFNLTNIFNTDSILLILLKQFSVSHTFLKIITKNALIRRRR